ncbi:hypothetical protein, conserved [Eimeria tenella]|uniref:Uncharacterized protein n=1 Tax=Eimeria tenella TaxID=5802 RepID=U6L4I1_EIMTE|nr:hypothetical protein, conserved [Eimeria tenella]CDJ42685.1 hypothetical protein, conserved [Eimeria tenella]|eukprot:XP_013233435.1 hypothetical protein, conserved [Eimeria tenella]
MVGRGSSISSLPREASPAAQSSRRGTFRGTSSSSNRSSNSSSNTCGDDGPKSMGGAPKGARLLPGSPRRGPPRGCRAGAPLKPLNPLQLRRANSSSNSNSSKTSSSSSLAALNTAADLSSESTEPPQEPQQEQPLQQQHQQRKTRLLPPASPAGNIRGASRGKEPRPNSTSPQMDVDGEGGDPRAPVGTSPIRSVSTQRRTKQQRGSSGAALPSPGGSTAAARRPSSRRRKTPQSNRASNAAAATEQQQQQEEQQQQQQQRQVKTPNSRRRATTPVRQGPEKADCADCPTSSSKRSSSSSMISSSSSSSSDSEYDEDNHKGTQRPSRPKALSPLLSRTSTESLALLQQQQQPLGSPLSTGAAATNSSSSNTAVLVRGALIAPLTPAGSPLREGLGPRRKAASLLQLAEASPIATQQPLQQQQQQGSEGPEGGAACLPPAAAATPAAAAADNDDDLILVQHGQAAKEEAEAAPKEPSTVTDELLQDAVAVLRVAAAAGAAGAADTDDDSCCMTVTREPILIGGPHWKGSFPPNCSQCGCPREALVSAEEDPGGPPGAFRLLLTFCDTQPKESQYLSHLSFINLSKSPSSAPHSCGLLLQAHFISQQQQQQKREKRQQEEQQQKKQKHELQEDFQNARLKPQQERQQQEQVQPSGGAVVSLLRSFIKPFVRASIEQQQPKPEKQHRQKEEEQQQEQEQQKQTDKQQAKQQQQLQDEAEDVDKDIWFDAQASQQPSGGVSSTELQQPEPGNSSSSCSSTGSSMETEPADVTSEGKQVLLQLIEVKECQRPQKSQDVTSPGSPLLRPLDLRGGVEGPRSPLSLLRRRPQGVLSQPLSLRASQGPPLSPLRHSQTAAGQLLLSASQEAFTHGGSEERGPLVSSRGTIGGPRGAGSLVEGSPVRLQPLGPLEGRRGPSKGPMRTPAAAPEFELEVAAEAVVSWNAGISEVQKLIREFLNRRFGEGHGAQFELLPAPRPAGGDGGPSGLRWGASQSTLSAHWVFELPAVEGPSVPLAADFVRLGASLGPGTPENDSQNCDGGGLLRSALAAYFKVKGAQPRAAFSAAPLPLAAASAATAVEARAAAAASAAPAAATAAVSVEIDPHVSEAFETLRRPSEVFEVSDDEESLPDDGSPPLRPSVVPGAVDAPLGGLPGATGAPKASLKGPPHAASVAPEAVIQEVPRGAPGAPEVLPESVPQAAPGSSRAPSAPLEGPLQTAPAAAGSPCEGPQGVSDLEENQSSLPETEEPAQSESKPPGQQQERVSSQGRSAATEAATAAEKAAAASDSAGDPASEAAAASEPAAAAARAAASADGEQSVSLDEDNLHSTPKRLLNSLS